MRATSVVPGLRSARARATRRERATERRPRLLSAAAGNPDELRRREIDLVAIARFRIGANGATEVELVQPTPEPSLNRALRESLKRWRFFPALESRRPVASTVDIRIPVSVKSPGR